MLLHVLMPHAFVTFLRSYCEIPKADEVVIQAAAEHRFYKEGAMLLQEGHMARELFFVEDGVLKITAVNEKGKDITYFFVKEQQFCTILNSFNNQLPASESIYAACDTTVLVFSKTSLEYLYKQLPYIKEVITQIMQQRLLDKIALRNRYMGEDSASRYQLFLEQQPDVALRVSLTDIASYLGITPQSLSRIRKNTR
jgi:CRP-like cAMP-binding protein